MGEIDRGRSHPTDALGHRDTKACQPPCVLAVDTPSIPRHHLLALGAEAFDGKGDHVAGVEIGRRLAPVADAGRRAGGDDVAVQSSLQIYYAMEELRG